MMVKKMHYCSNCKWFDKFNKAYDTLGCSYITYFNPKFSKKGIDHKGGKCYYLYDKKLIKIILNSYGLDEKKYFNYWENGLKDCNFNEKYDCIYYKRKWWKFWVR